MTKEKTELDRIEERFDKAVEVEAKSRCFKSQTARIFWDGFGGEENHKKWVDNVKCDSDFIKSFYRKEIEELVKRLIPLESAEGWGEPLAMAHDNGFNCCREKMMNNAKSLGINLY